MLLKPSMMGAALQVFVMIIDDFFVIPLSRFEGVAKIRLEGKREMYLSILSFSTSSYLLMSPTLPCM